MLLESAKLLQDALDCAERIAAYTHGKTRHNYLAEQALRDAVQWNFAVIGEALSKLQKIDAPTTDLITECRRIVAFRNQLIHGYGVIHHGITWDIIQNKLPILLTDLRTLLKNPG